MKKFSNASFLTAFSFALIFAEYGAALSKRILGIESLFLLLIVGDVAFVMPNDLLFACFWEFEKYLLNTALPGGYLFTAEYLFVSIPVL